MRASPGWRCPKFSPALTAPGVPSPQPWSWAAWAVSALGMCAGEPRGPVPFAPVRAGRCASGFLRFPGIHKPRVLRQGPELARGGWARLTGRISPTAMLDEDGEERVDEAALRQLTEMGFPEGRAAKALRLSQYVGPPPWAWAPAVPGSPRRHPSPHTPSLRRL